MSELSYPMIVFPANEEDGGGFAAFAPDLPGCASYGDTPQEALADLPSAIGEWIDEAQRLGREVPAPGSLGERADADRLKIFELVKKQDALIRTQDQSLREAREELEELRAGVSSLMSIGGGQLQDHPVYTIGAYRRVSRSSSDVVMGLPKAAMLHN